MSSVLRRTSNYSKFVPLSQNRVVRLNRNTVKRLKESMGKYGFIPAFPLLVIHNGNNMLLIKSGHHRFEVAKELGLPVWYVVCDNDLTIAEIEGSTTSWSTAHFVQSHVRSGNKPEYEKLDEFSERTGISTNMSAVLLSGISNEGSGSFTRKLKSGDFEVKDKKLAETVGEIVIHCRVNGIKFADSSLFVAALSKVVLVPGFDLKTLKYKIKSHTSLMKKQASQYDYIALIQRVYNRQNSNLLPIMIEVEKMDRARKSH
jgi:hypothetical protein